MIYYLYNTNTKIGLSKIMVFNENTLAYYYNNPIKYLNFDTDEIKDEKLLKELKLWKKHK